MSCYNPLKYYQKKIIVTNETKDFTKNDDRMTWIKNEFGNNKKGINNERTQQINRRSVNVSKGLLAIGHVSG